MIESLTSIFNRICSSCYNDSVLACLGFFGLFAYLFVLIIVLKEVLIYSLSLALTDCHLASASLVFGLKNMTTLPV